RGEVQSPVAVAYEPGKSIDYYIRAAGGPTRLGDLKRAYVVQANGSVSSRRRAVAFVSVAPKPTPGSEIRVPAKDTSEKRDVIAAVGSIAQILASIVAVVAIAKR